MLKSVVIDDHYLSNLHNKNENTLLAKVFHKLFLGDCVSYYLTVGDYEFRVKTDSHLRSEIGKDVFLSIQPENVMVVPSG